MIRDQMRNRLKALRTEHNSVKQAATRKSESVMHGVQTGTTHSRRRRLVTGLEVINSRLEIAWAVVQTNKIVCKIREGRKKRQNLFGGGEVQPKIRNPGIEIRSE
jgi:hypothetical protein